MTTVWLLISDAGLPIGAYSNENDAYVMQEYSAQVDEVDADVVAVQVDFGVQAIKAGFQYPWEVVFIRETGELDVVRKCDLITTFGKHEPYRATWFFNVALPLEVEIMIVWAEDKESAAAAAREALKAVRV